MGRSAPDHDPTAPHRDGRGGRAAGPRAGARHRAGADASRARHRAGGPGEHRAAETVAGRRHSGGGAPRVLIAPCPGGTTRKTWFPSRSSRVVDRPQGWRSRSGSVVAFGLVGFIVVGLVLGSALGGGPRQPDEAAVAPSPVATRAPRPSNRPTPTRTPRPTPLPSLEVIGGRIPTEERLVQGNGFELLDLADGTAPAGRGPGQTARTSRSLAAIRVRLRGPRPDARSRCHDRPLPPHRSGRHDRGQPTDPPL